MRHRNFIIGATVATLAVAGHVPTPAPAQDPDATVLYLDVNRPITTSAGPTAGARGPGTSTPGHRGRRRLRRWVLRARLAFYALVAAGDRVLVGGEFPMAQAAGER